MATMDFAKIYRVLSVGKRTALHVRPRTDIKEDEYELYRGSVQPHYPLVFEFFKGASGNTANDFISTSLSPLKLISDRVIETLRPFSGWTTYPVEVYGKKGERIPGYHGLAVTGRCGPIDDSRSVPRIVPPPVPQGRASRQWFGLFFDETTWDGSDVFCPIKGGGSLFVTDTVKRSLEDARITNIDFTPLTEASNMSSALMFGKRE